MKIADMLRDGEGTDRDTIRLLLHRWGRAVAFCAERQKEIARLKDMLVDLVTMRSKEADMPVAGTGGFADPTYAAAVRLTQLSRQYEDRMNALAAECSKEMALAAELDALIGSLPASQPRLLSLRYRAEMEWTEIAKKMKYSESHIKRQHAAALDLLAELITVEPGG